MSAIDPGWAWARYEPSRSQPWTLTRVGHLFRRAGFGATWAELRKGLADGPQVCVDRLLAGGPDAAPFPASIAKSNNGFQLTAWWLKRLLESGNPLREKMTLFWHNHFATSNAKVNNAGAMIGMYDSLYQHALGDFSALVHSMTLDPAMMVWLDTVTSSRGKPNENFARELMELFTLGIGHYSEADIREAARALTGYEIKAGRPTLNRTKHDGSPKQVFHQSGNFEAGQIVDLCLAQPSCPYLIVGKLFRFLVSETMTPDRDLIAPLAEEYRKKYDTKALVERILRSNLFFSDRVYRTRIKSPVDFAVGIVRGLEGNVPASALSLALESLGQKLAYPPSVKGWDGGPAWLNGQTLLFRQNLALALTSTEDDRFKSRTDPARLVRSHGMLEGDRPVEFFLGLFVQDDIPATTRERLTRYLSEARRAAGPGYLARDEMEDRAMRSLCHLVLTQPEFQLD